MKNRQLETYIKDIENGKAVVGTKQVLKCLKANELAYVILAKDADSFVKEKILENVKDLKIVYVPSKQKLGEDCHISVKCAVCGIKK